MNAPRVLSVGQCGMDHSSISHFLQKQFGATTIRVHTHEEAFIELHANHVDLVLVNRVTDYDGSLGLEFIRALRNDATFNDIPVMLVSNYPDAQADAVTLGAIPGFGKSQLRERSTEEKLMNVFAQVVS